MKNVLRKRVFPTKPGSKRQKGVAKPTVGFRAPEDIVAWLNQMEQSGADRAAVMITSIRLARDVAARFGESWYELEYRAKRAGLEPGAMLADLALAAIAAEGGPAVKPPKK